MILVRHMESVGRKIVALQADNVNLDNVTMGFHVYPFCSVDHLHLHVLHGQWTCANAKYGFLESVMWYRSLEQIIRQVEAKQGKRE